MAARRENGVWVNDTGELATIIVNADGTPVSAGGGGGVSYVDDSAFTVGVSSITPVGGIVTADSVDAGDAGAFAMLANRQQKITLYDSSGVEITSFGGGTQYTEDAAAPANPVGNAIIVVRADTLAGLTTTDGDNVGLRGTDKGELYVKHVDALTVSSHAVTNAGTFAVQVDSSSLPTGAATSAKQDTEIGHLATLAGAVAGTEFQVDVLTMPSVAVTNAGLTELAAAINASSQMDVNIAASNATVTVAQATAANLNMTEASAATIATNTGNAATSLSVLDDWDNAASDGASISGDVAHDTADAGEPVKIGGKAVSAEPTAVAANDRVNALFDLVGKMIVLPYANPENFVSGAITSAMTGTTSTSLIAAPAAGLRNYITQITVSNSHATVLTDVLIQDGSGGTTLYVLPAPALSGSVINLPTPLRQPTTATAIFAQNVTTGANVKVSASGYKGV